MNKRPDWSQSPFLIAFLWLAAILALTAAALMFVYSEPGHWQTDKIERDWSYIE